MASWEVTFTMALKKMFKMVGRTYPDPEFTKDVNWYTKETWTEKEEKRFKKWLYNLIRRRHPEFTKKRIEWECGLFNLCYGWSVEYES